MEECSAHLRASAGLWVRREICDEDVARALRSVCHSQVIADFNADLAKTDSEDDAGALRRHVARSPSAFSERHRRIESSVVQDPAFGEIHSQPELASEVLTRHWAPIFAGAPAPWRAAMRPFLPEWSRLPVGEVVDPLSLEEVTGIHAAHIFVLFARPIRCLVGDGGAGSQAHLQLVPPGDPKRRLATIRFLCLSSGSLRACVGAQARP